MPPKAAEEAIRQAMQEGKFDNLPGKGKPLKLDENPLADPEWRLAYKILKDGGFTLPWIETRREIEADLERAHAALKRSWNWRQAALAQGQPVSQVDPEWQRAAQAFQDFVKAINQRIQAYNLEVPSERFQRPPVKADQVIESLQQS
jgi:DnaJ family protein C protein 28